MPQLEVSPMVAIEKEEGKSIPTAKLLEVLSRMGVQLKPGVAPEEVFTRDLASPPFPSRERASWLESVSPKNVPWVSDTGVLKVEAREAAEGRARESEEVILSGRDIQVGPAERIAIGEARRTLGRVVTEAHYTDKDYIIERHGKPEAAVIGIKDYERLQRLETERDVRLLQKAKRKARGFVSAEQLVSDYGKRFGEKIFTPSEEG